MDGNINRYFIQQALDEAVKNLKTKGAFNDIEIDQATRDEPGTPDIPDNILKKIDECSIFVADITFINEKSAKRRIPNPNVLIELGYAVKKHGFEKIIVIFNSEFGKPEELPFDIKHRKITPYQYNSSMDKNTALLDLTNELEKAILIIDRKTITKEKIDFILYNRDEGKQYEENFTINAVIYKRLTEDDFIRGMNYNELRELKERKKFSEWQEYLYKEIKEYKERKAAFTAMIGKQILSVGTVINQDETKDYYNKYMISSLIWLNTYKFDFLIKNNNEQTLKNVKIVLKTEKKNRIKRKFDFPNLPSSSILSSMIYGIQQNNEQPIFQIKEYGDYIDFEYMKDNLYASEEYILDEPLYIPLHEQDVVKIEYTIFSDNLSKINGILEINMKNEVKTLLPTDVFYKL